MIKWDEKKVLVTGGCGFIGSHCVLELMKLGHTVISIDNFSTSNYSIVNLIKSRFDGFTNYDVDISNSIELQTVFEREPNVDIVIHFAAYKAVGESVQNPLKYYHNNVTSTINLLKCMDKFNIRKLIYPSSATVYGSPEQLPITEESNLCPTNPYGQTKLICEQILSDLARSELWTIMILRYFNPVGAHLSGLVGENIDGTPTNLMPCLLQNIVGIRPIINVFGSDYSTHDGTCIRDYIHIMDLIDGHISVMNHMKDINNEFNVFNLGTGKGYSVMEMIKTLEQVSGVKIKYELGERRSGDVAEVYADCSKIERLLGWKAKRTLVDMCRDSWNYVTKMYRSE